MRSPDHLTAVGIGVADLARSADFYSRVLGMREMRRFSLPHMEEVVLAHEGRVAVILMHWTDGSARNYADCPVKLVFYVVDPVRLAAAIAAEGFAIDRPPAPSEEMGGAVLALARDPDGYVIELIEAPCSSAPASSGSATAA